MTDKLQERANKLFTRANDHYYGETVLTKGQLSALKAGLTRLAKKVNRHSYTGEYIHNAAQLIDHDDRLTFEGEVVEVVGKVAVTPQAVEMKEVIPSVFKIKLVRESGLRIEDRDAIRNPYTAVSIAENQIGDSDRENLLIILLDTRHRVIGANIAHIGTVNSLHGSAREIFKPAILSNAAAIILAHNHPSGDPSPSPEDVQMTRELVAAGKILDIEIVDHLVIGEPGRFVSLKERGLGF